MSTQEQVCNLLKEIKPTKDLSGITDIIEGGYLDSFELMSLIAQLGEIFGIEIDVDEIVPENFNSVDAMTAMVERLKH
ncbi:MAG: acyl carrier protein [Clostridia bacterium]|nr:acyl carrier protein [Clostridia bacterium]